MNLCACRRVFDSPVVFKLEAFFRSSGNEGGWRAGRRWELSQTAARRLRFIAWPERAPKLGWDRSQGPLDAGRQHCAPRSASNKGLGEARQP